VGRGCIPHAAGERAPPGIRDIAQIQLGGLLAAAEISAHYDDAHVVAAFDKAIEMLGDAAITQVGG